MSAMLPINVEDLLHCRTIESARVEFKAAWHPETTGFQILKTLCAFANDYQNLNGGYVVLGVAERDGRGVMPPAGLSSAEIEAAAQRAMNEADNLLSVEQVGMKVKLAIVDRLQEIIRESVRPMERIEGIRILQVGGLNGGDGGASAGPAGTNDNLAEQVVASALRYRAQAPILDALLNELGLAATDPGGLTALVRRQVDAGMGNDGNEDTDGAAI